MIVQNVFIENHVNEYGKNIEIFIDEMNLNLLQNKINEIQYNTSHNYIM